MRLSKGKRNKRKQNKNTKTKIKQNNTHASSIIMYKIITTKQS